MHDSAWPGAVAMRMGIFFGGASVRGPAGMADAVSAAIRSAARTIDRRFLNDFFEIAKLAGCAANFQFARRIHNGNAGGIVAAVFEFAQAFNNDGHNFFWADIADNAAHAETLLKADSRCVACELDRLA